MQFSSLFLVGLAATVQSVFAAHCSIERAVLTDCCWGGGNPFMSCFRQNFDRAFCKQDTENYCTGVLRNGRPVSETCGADCCDTRSGWGTGCPK